MRKSSLARMILQQMGELGFITLDAFFPPQYSYARMWRPLLGLEHPPQITRHAISMNLWRLQKQGLVRKSKYRKSSVWKITTEGKQRLRYQSEMSRNKELKRDGIVRIVTFDIPERERKKRDAIRAELIGYHFKQLQKSVWIGENELPEEFIVMIREFNLSKNVHIFSVREKGTLLNG